MTTEEKTGEITADGRNGRARPEIEIPIIALRLSSYKGSVGAADALEALGGVERYDDYAARDIWEFSDSKPIADLLRSDVAKYRDADTAAAWLERLDKGIDAEVRTKADVEPFALVRFRDDDDMDAYSDIEAKWVEAHNLGENLEMFRQSCSSIKEMKGADDKAWTDAFILDMNTSFAMRDQLGYSRNRQLLEDWTEFVDDLMLLYMGTLIYVGVRGFGRAKVYAI